MSALIMAGTNRRRTPICAVTALGLSLGAALASGAITVAPVPSGFILQAGNRDLVPASPPVLGRRGRKPRFPKIV